MSPLSAGAKRALMELASKKAARKTPVKAVRVTGPGGYSEKHTPASVKGLAKAAVKAPTKVSALMPCRFCKLNTGNIQDGIPSLGYWVRCFNKDCLCSGPRKDNIIAAVAAWNN